MKFKTSVIENNGTTYMRIPPALKAHLGIKVGDDTVVIEDKKKKHGKYGVFWGVDSDGKEKKRD